MQAKARDFLASSQIQGEETNLSYGGFPYQSKSDPTRAGRPVERAVRGDGAPRGGRPRTSPVWGRLLAYLDTVQNRSETNTPVVKRHDKELNADVEIVSGNDGGAGYAPG